MITKNEMIDLLKIEFPTLRIGDEDNGYTELSIDDYEDTISKWADARLAKEVRAAEAEAEAEAKAEAKAALLDRLGITAEEAALLLA
jgi:hypothetical protein